MISHGEYPVGKVLEGGSEDLWDILAHVTAEVANTGSVHGAEVAQLYLGIPGGLVRQSRWFDKVNIHPGQQPIVNLDLTRRDLSVWDTIAQKWKLQSGAYKIYVGASSRDLPLLGTLAI